jgi:hypothetical protein
MPAPARRGRCTPGSTLWRATSWTQIHAVAGQRGVEHEHREKSESVAAGAWKTAFT